MSGTMFRMSPRPWFAATGVALAAACLASCSTLTGESSPETAPIPSLTFDVTTTTRPLTTSHSPPRRRPARRPRP